MSRAGCAGVDEEEQEELDGGCELVGGGEGGGWRGKVNTSKSYFLKSSMCVLCLFFPLAVLCAVFGFGFRFRHGLSHAPFDNYHACTLQYPIDSA